MSTTPATDANTSGNLDSATVGALLRFIDFVYAVVFADFARRVYQQCIIAPPTGDRVPLLPNLSLDQSQALALVFSGLIFFFVASDWIHARILSDPSREPYRSYLRFFLDLGIAFIAYGALYRATEGHISATLYLTGMFAGGAVWAFLCLWQHSDSAYRSKYRLILGSHLVAAIVFGAFYWSFRDEAMISVTSLLAFSGLLFSVFLLEEVLHVAFLPKKQWIGPSGIPFTRNFILKRVKAARQTARDLYDRIFK